MTTTFDQSMQLKKIGLVQYNRLLYVTGPDIPVPVIYDESIPGQGLKIHCCAFSDSQLIQMIGYEPRLKLTVDIPSGLDADEFRYLMWLRVGQARINALFEILINQILDGENTIDRINLILKTVSIS